MEVVAAVSSVASIVSLLGQVIGKTKRFRDFIADVSSASTSVEDLLHDINFHLQTLFTFSEMLDTLSIDIEEHFLRSVHGQLDRYMIDLCRWLEKARAILPSSSIGARKWLKSFWIALNIKSVEDLHLSLDRHSQKINISLEFLGRKIEVSTASEIRSLQGNVTQGISASLSRIEQQNSVLANIETYSITGMQHSAASVKSLRSIASSLSRIEAFTSSAASASGSQGVRGSERSNMNVRTSRRRTADFDRRSRRLSTRSPLSRGHSSASAKSMPAIPTIPKEVFCDVLMNAPQTAEVLTKTDGSQGSEAIKVNETIHEKKQSLLLKDGVPLVPRAWEDSFRSVTKQLGLHCHPILLDYILQFRTLRMLEDKASLLKMLKLTLQHNVETQSKVEKDDHDVLLESIVRTRGELHRTRKECILKGYFLHEIDLCFQRAPGISQDFWDTPYLHIAIQDSLVTGTGRTAFPVYGHWSSSRGRINNWLLHCILSDESQQELHASMLAESPVGHNDWTDQVLESWNRDEAAVGEDFQASHSLQAVQILDETVSAISFGMEWSLLADFELCEGDLDIHQDAILTKDEMPSLIELEKSLFTSDKYEQIREDLERGDHDRRYDPHLHVLMAICNYKFAIDCPSKILWIRQLDDILWDFKHGVHILLERIKSSLHDQPGMMYDDTLRTQRIKLLLRLNLFVDDLNQKKDMSEQYVWADRLDYSKATKVGLEATTYLQIWRQLLYAVRGKTKTTK